MVVDSVAQSGRVGMVGTDCGLSRGLKGVAVGTRLLNFYGLRVNLFDCLKQSVPACMSSTEIFLLIRIVEDTCTKVEVVRVQRLRQFGAGGEVQRDD
jgi:hypothetical protein